MPNFAYALRYYIFLNIITRLLYNFVKSNWIYFDEIIYRPCNERIALVIQVQFLWLINFSGHTKSTSHYKQQ